MNIFAWVAIFFSAELITYEYFMTFKTYIIFQQGTVRDTIL